MILQKETPSLYRVNHFKGINEAGNSGAKMHLEHLTTLYLKDFQFIF